MASTCRPVRLDCQLNPVCMEQLWILGALDRKCGSIQKRWIHWREEVREVWHGMVHFMCYCCHLNIWVMDLSLSLRHVSLLVDDTAYCRPRIQCKNQLGCRWARLSHIAPGRVWSLLWCHTTYLPKYRRLMLRSSTLRRFCWALPSSKMVTAQTALLCSSLSRSWARSARPNNVPDGTVAVDNITLSYYTDQLCVFNIISRLSNSWLANNNSPSQMSVKSSILSYVAVSSTKYITARNWEHCGRRVP